MPRKEDGGSSGWGVRAVLWSAGMALCGIASRVINRKAIIVPETLQGQKLCKARGSRCELLFYRNARQSRALQSWVLFSGRCPRRRTVL
jgi:hypothetical protein